MFRTIDEAETLVKHREARLARAEQLHPDRPGYIRKCQENLENAKWSLRHARREARA